MDCACIITGVIFVGRSINNGDNKNKSASKKGLIIPVLGSLAIAFSQIVRKEGLNIYSQPLLGVAVGYTTAVIVYLLVIAVYKNAGARRFSGKDIRRSGSPESA